MMTEIQKIILTCCLGPEDPLGFKKYCGRHYRKSWLSKKPDGGTAYNLERKVKYEQRHPGSLKKSQKKSVDNPENSAVRWAARLMKAYGLSAIEWRRLLDNQEGKCAICGKDFVKPPHVDHCHATKKVRGLLCFNCNSGIGYFKDSPEICALAERYLS